MCEHIYHSAGVEVTRQLCDILPFDLYVNYAALHRPAVMVHACNPRTWKVEAGESEVQGHFWAHGKFEAAKGYMKPHPVSLPIPGGTVLQGLSLRKVKNH